MESLQLWQHTVAWMSGHVIAPVLTLLPVDLEVAPAQIAESVLLSLIQLGIIALIFRPMETLMPAERWQDRAATRTDIQYSLIAVLGLFPLVSALTLLPLAHHFGGPVAAAAVGDADSPFAITRAFPSLDRYPLLLFLVSYLIYDFFYYWLHRAQHAIPWMWALHSVHHSQRQVSCWTNDRDSYLSGALEAAVLASVGFFIGVSPSQFILLMLCGELLQNFSHANVRIGFGPLLDKVFVGPRFHRLHHMWADPARPRLHDCNYAQAFPIWDILFGTALYSDTLYPTGVGDPDMDADHKRSLIGQQWSALQRFWKIVRWVNGWKPSKTALMAEPYQGRLPPS